MFDRVHIRRKEQIFKNISMKKGTWIPFKYKIEVTEKPDVAGSVLIPSFFMAKIVTELPVLYYSKTIRADIIG